MLKTLATAALALLLLPLCSAQTDPIEIERCATLREPVPGICKILRLTDLSPLDVHDGYPCCRDCKACPAVRNTCDKGCEGQTRDVTVSYRSKNVTFVHGACTTWLLANETCCNVYGGRLWEPASRREYRKVMQLAINEAPALKSACKWWIGLNNFCPPYGSKAFYASDAPSTANPISWMDVTDGCDNGSQNCVDIRDDAWNWGDENCRCTLQKFICETAVDGGGQSTSKTTTRSTIGTQPTIGTVEPTRATLGI